MILDVKSHLGRTVNDLYVRPEKARSMLSRLPFYVAKAISAGQYNSLVLFNAQITLSELYLIFNTTNNPEGVLKLRQGRCEFMRLEDEIRDSSMIYLSRQYLGRRVKKITANIENSLSQLS